MLNKCVIIIIFHQLKVFEIALQHPPGERSENRCDFRPNTIVDVVVVIVARVTVCRQQALDNAAYKMCL